MYLFNKEGGRPGIDDIGHSKLQRAGTPQNGGERIKEDSSTKWRGRPVQTGTGKKAPGKI